jgi:hypothetical protein
MSRKMMVMPVSSRAEIELSAEDYAGIRADISDTAFKWNNTNPKSLQIVVRQSGRAARLIARKPGKALVTINCTPLDKGQRRRLSFYVKVVKERQ